MRRARKNLFFARNRMIHKKRLGARRKFPRKFITRVFLKARGENPNSLPVKGSSEEVAESSKLVCEVNLKEPVSHPVMKNNFSRVRDSEFAKDVKGRPTDGGENVVVQQSCVRRTVNFLSFEG